jgi:hypothetical protein
MKKNMGLYPVFKPEATMGTRMAMIHKPTLFGDLLSSVFGQMSYIFFPEDR